jgi:phosphoglycolate phosphatase
MEPITIKAIVLDLDGTLLDTAGDIAAAANRMLQELGRAPLDEATVRSYIGNGVSRLVKRALTGTFDGEPEPALFDAAMALFRKHYTQTLTATTRPYPGVREGLQAMKDAGFRLACITNKAACFTTPLLAAMELAPFFEAVIAGDALPAKKPDPLPLIHLAGQFGVAPEEMLLIGDSKNDVQAARAAGCHVFCVPYGYNRDGDVRALGPDRVVERIGDALESIALAAP